MSDIDDNWGKFTYQSKIRNWTKPNEGSPLFFFDDENRSYLRYPPGWAGGWSRDYNSWVDNFEATHKEYEQIVEWILANIEDPYNNARWVFAEDWYRMCFRHERDLILFVLKWA